jgi:hypothetical protein
MPATYDTSIDGFWIVCNDELQPIFNVAPLVNVIGCVTNELYYPATVPIYDA